MPLIIEDGSIVADAVAYVTVEEARAFNLLRGVALSVVDSEVELLIQKAMDYFEQLEEEFQGVRTDIVQELSWPRAGVTLYDRAIADDVIPKPLKSAICQLVGDAVSTDLLPTGTGREVIRQKVDVIETEYAPTGSGVLLPQLTKALAFMKPLFRNGSGGFTLDVLRT